MTFDLMEHQQEAVDGMAAQAAPLRACLYFKTGAGKTYTGLLGVRGAGCDAALVVAPPSTHDAWTGWGQTLGVEVTCISHAKFRQKGFKVSRHTPLIVDEFHLLGGHRGQGWLKLDALARGLQAPLLALSATPNYNDAERVYCIQHVLDPASCKGGYIEFLYRECETETNPFGMEPIVTGFRNYGSAAEYLAALPYVYYLEDDLDYTIVDVEAAGVIEPWFDQFGYDARSHRIMASDIEARHKRVFNNLVRDNGNLCTVAWKQITTVKQASKPLLVFAAHSTVAEAAGRTLKQNKIKHAVVTGSTTKKQKLYYLEAFRRGELEVLVGTASLATGPDGLDKVCDQLFILDDTDDDSLRRQLIGRIMPRGLDTDATGKSVHRLLFS